MNTLVDEVFIKEDRVRHLISKLGCDSLLLTRRANFSWFTCGKRAVVSYATEASPVYILITPKKKYLIGYCMDIPRTMEEEVSGQGFESVSLPSYEITSTSIEFGKSIMDAVNKLAEGKLVADIEIGEIPSINNENCINSTPIH